MISIDEVKSQIEKAVPGVSLKVVRGTLLIENPKHLPDVAQFLKSSDYRMDYLSSVTAADYLKHLETVYHFYSVEKKSGPIVLRVRTDRNQPKIPSLVSIFRGAEYQERECFDMYGIVYEGHPDLRRIFMWDEFQGYPMRKDYVQEDSELLDKTDLAWLDRHGVKVTDEVRKLAENPPPPKKPGASAEA